MSNFPDYAGPLTETILLGQSGRVGRRQRQGRKGRMGPANMKVKNIAGLDPSSSRLTGRVTR